MNPNFSTQHRGQGRPARRGKRRGRRGHRQSRALSARSTVSGSRAHPNGGPNNAARPPIAAPSWRIGGTRHRLGGDETDLTDIAAIMVGRAALVWTNELVPAKELRELYEYDDMTDEQFLAANKAIAVWMASGTARVSNTGSDRAPGARRCLRVDWTSGELALLQRTANTARRRRCRPRATAARVEIEESHSGDIYSAHKVPAKRYAKGSCWPRLNRAGLPDGSFATGASQQQARHVRYAPESGSNFRASRLETWSADP